MIRGPSLNQPIGKASFFSALSDLVINKKIELMAIEISASDQDIQYKTL